MSTVNYDVSLLTVEILTGNLWSEDDPPGTEWWDEDSWVNVLDRLHSITISNAVSYDTLNFSPQAGAARISIGTSAGDDFFARLHARPIRVRYDGSTLFSGKILETNTTVSPDEVDTHRYDVDLSCASNMYDLSKFQLTNFTAPTETGADRLDRICTAIGKAIVCTGLTTFHSGRILEAYTGDALSLLNELQLAHHARFYVTTANILTMTDADPEIVVRFNIDDDLDFCATTFTGSDDQHLSASLAILKSNEFITDYRTSPTPYTVRAEQYLVDVANAAELADWNAAVRLRDFPAVIARTVRTTDVATTDWSAVHCTELAVTRLPNRGPSYQTGIVSINHSIDPDRWVVDLEMCQRYFVNDDSTPEA